MPSEERQLDHLKWAQKRVLIAALNWGLGHVARCIPIIKSLQKMGAEVLLASDGMALNLLKAEFPHLPVLHLPAYKIQYFSKNMVLNIARQMPRMLYAIHAEHRHTQRIVQKHKIQGIISDNRYGCFSTKTNNILLTHQLNLRVPQKALQWTANKVLRRAFAQFNEIWVPDSASEPTLSGELSHPAKGIFKTRYIGLLSRVQNIVISIEKEYDVAVVLSGPEPQRTYLEHILLEQAARLPQKFIFILGKTGSKVQHYAADNVEVVSYLTSEELNMVLAASSCIVCRSGYSSLMDLASLNKPALLVPTPGQTEQEYLAEYLSDNNQFVVQQQANIDLKTALNKLKESTEISGIQMPVNKFEPLLKTWLEALV